MEEQDPLKEAERRIIEATLQHAGNNHSMAARMLRISRTTLLRKLERYGTETM